MITQLIEEATLSGARLEAAAGAIGLSIRTLQRWNFQDDNSDQRRGPSTAPSNKLAPAERQNILDIANSPEFRDLSPKQIVPQLADQGLYVASESSIYRVLRSENQMAHREPSRPATRRKPKEHVATGPCQVWGYHLLKESDSWTVLLLIPDHGCLEPQDCRVNSVFERVLRL
jgi:putative transposase